jgi:RNA polymerase sigma-70 factor (ECF subfamily)
MNPVPQTHNNAGPGNFSPARLLSGRLQGGKLATHKELSEFLAEVERRAYKQALFAVRDDHAALDVVQDAMLKLTERYGARPVAELPLLFQRILQNTIRDFYRRQKVRSIWTTPLSSLFGSDSGEEQTAGLMRRRLSIFGSPASTGSA